MEKLTVAALNGSTIASIFSKNLHPVNAAEETPLLIKILTTSDNGYTFEYATVGSAQKARGTAVKID